MPPDKVGAQHESPRDLTPCCGFARQAQEGDEYAQGLRVWFTDTGKMRCFRCILEVLKAADEQLASERRRERRRLLGLG